MPFGLFWNNWCILRYKILNEEINNEIITEIEKEKIDGWLKDYTSLEIVFW